KESLSEQFKEYFQNQKLESFKDKPLKRYISSAKHQFEQLFFQNIFAQISDKNRTHIDQLLLETSTDKQSDSIVLAELKKDIPGARLKNVNYAIKKIHSLQKSSINPSSFTGISRKLLLKYYDRIMALSPSEIMKYSITARYSMMAMFCYVRSQLLLDALVDTFTKLIHRMRTNAQSYVDKNILKDVKRVDGKFDILEKLAKATADNPKGVIEDKVYPDVPRDLLLELIKDLGQRGKWYQNQIRDKIHSNYAHGNRTILLPLLQLFDFKEDHATYQPILAAITFINQHWNASINEYYTETPPLEGIIPSAWHSMVVTETEGIIHVNKYNYEIAVLEQLKTFIGFKAIWINGAYRFRNPNEDIPKDFEQNREYYYDLLGLPMKPKAFTSELKQLLNKNLSDLNNSILTNDLVKIKPSNLNKNICITPSEPQAEPENIEKLQKEIVSKWSTINLIDILKECDLLINFTEQMETIAKNSSIPTEELRRRLLLCIYGIGSNTGLKRIGIANGDVSFNDLRYTKKRFINRINVRNAIRMVVNSVLDLRDPAVWGEATTTVACDSTQVSAWDQNLLNEWHHRYKGKGVMIYWHVDKKALCIYSQLKSCSSSEVSSMIKGVIDHDTKMNMNQVFVDTHGQSVIGFAVSHMLDFDLLPRFKAINKQKLYGVTSKDKEEYKNISLIMKGGINWKLIEDNYDDVVKYMAALKLGIVEPSVLIKRFSHNNYNHPIYKALIEIGRAKKSIFLCKYLKSEDLRIEINEGLNVVERLNHVMDFIFYGKLGEL
ncbi:MAG: Tn3 family transposase, partial [Francisellaceae bacterium]|nr:Tn3 family transposase [Francisellaceae bacterium]